MIELFIRALFLDLVRTLSCRGVRIYNTTESNRTENVRIIQFPNRISTIQFFKYIFDIFEVETHAVPYVAYIRRGAPREAQVSVSLRFWH